MAAASASGCFEYRAADPAAIRVGQQVRLTLTPAGSADLAQQVGPRVETLGGRVIESRDSALAVAVTQLTRARSSDEFWPGDSVIVPVRGLNSVAVRQLDRKRTWLAVGGTAVAVFLMRRVIEEAGVFGSRPGPPPSGR